MGQVTIDETYDFSTGQGRYEVTSEGFIDAFGVVNNIATTVFTDVSSIRPGWIGALIRKDFWDGVNGPAFEWGIDHAAEWTPATTFLPSSKRFAELAARWPVAGPSRPTAPLPGSMSM